ncbi:MAG: hypothetical protein P4L84_06775 [Isosphaeraceae bacterium]|nr:hypothetical protein [Isosphaeraceae bacterium]
MVWIGLGAWWVACAALGWYVSAQKGRGAAEGLVLGLLFGPLGVAVALLLPTVATLYPRLRAEEGGQLLFECPACGCEARTNREQGGQLVSCARCRSRLHVPPGRKSVASDLPAHAPVPTTFVPAKSALPLPADRYLQGELIVWVCRCGEERMARRDQPGETGPCRKCGAVFEIPG